MIIWVVEKQFGDEAVLVQKLSCVELVNPGDPDDMKAIGLFSHEGIANQGSVK